jgi:hypothetical protein
MIDLLPEMVTLASEVFPELVKLLPLLTPLLVGLLSAISNLFGATKNYGEAMGGLTSNMPGWVTVLSTLVPVFGVWASLFDNARQGVQIMVEQISLSFQLLKEGLLFWWETVKELFTTGVETIVTTFTGGITALYEAGKAIMDGLLRGLEEAWVRVWAWVKAKAKAIADAFEDVLEIDSPSKVFFEIGQNIMEGLQLGVGSLTPEVDAQMAGVLQPSGFAGATGGMPAAGSQYNIVVNAGMGVDGARLGEQIVSAIRKYERASGPVFASA